MYLFILTLIPLPVLANAGIPIIILTETMIIGAFIPIVFIEFFVYKNNINLSNKRLLGLTTYMNIISTIIGVPLGWIAYLAFSLISIFLGMLVFESDQMNMFFGAQSPIVKEIIEGIFTTIHIN